ncbi:MAG: hypothetical protein HY843_00895 [Bdellovibrio sp.]|nr:hypothetical protein [Bdellovibrio sp.]
MSYCKIFFVIIAILVIEGLNTKLCFGKAAGEYAPAMDMGVAFFTGTSGKSMTGALAEYFNFRAEDRKGFFRPQAAMEILTAVGKASIGTDTPSASLYNASFIVGVHLFPFTAVRFAPFVGGSGVVGWGYLKMGSPPSGVEANTQSIVYGYELTAGVDLRTGSLDGAAIRIKSGLYVTSGKLGGVSSFMLQGFRISLGMIW